MPTSLVRQILFVAPAPVVWAEHLGLFASEGLKVETTQTTSSDQIGQGLADGSWDIGIGVVDNVVAWNAGFSAGLRILAQLERSQPMAFCGGPGVASLADAASGPIAVDATSNGFVLVLYRALAAAGIDRAGCDFQKVGGVRQRFEALIGGGVSATMLVPPFIDMALSRGCIRIFDGAELAPAYPGVVATARGAWTVANRASALAYLGALQRANEWAMNPSKHADATAALVGARYSPDAAARLVQNAVPGLEPSRPGWDETIGLRRDVGLLHNEPPRFEDIADLELLASARVVAGNR
jgi:ABC-type nitrate/sulfonate/bicarbonate transport system substrate-binding protein